MVTGQTVAGPFTAVSCRCRPVRPVGLGLWDDCTCLDGAGSFGLSKSTVD